MNTWNDIYDYSDKIFRQVLEQIGEEKPVNEFSSPEILNGRLQEQIKKTQTETYSALVWCGSRNYVVSGFDLGMVGPGT